MKGTKTSQVGWNYYMKIICRLKVVNLGLFIRPLDRLGRLRPRPPQKPQPIPMHHIFDVLLFITALR